MKSRVVPLRIPEYLDELAALCGQEQHTDKATALRQWLHEGAAHYVLNLVSQGRVSIGRASELLDLSIYDLHHLAETHGIELGPTEDELKESRALAARLSRQ